MAKGQLRLCADDAGVWRANSVGERFGLAWAEIEWVRGSFSFGPNGDTAVAVELYSKNGGIGMVVGGPGRPTDAPFLDGVATAMAARLALPAHWYADLQRMEPARTPVTVWARAVLPRVHADDRGLWCHEFDQFTAWGRITGVAARKAPDGAITIELDVANVSHDDLLEVHQSRPGFMECVRGIASRLPQVPADWLADAQRSPAGAAVTVWRRTCPEGYPRLYADDLGVCREDTPERPADMAWDDIERVLGREREGHTEIELESADGIRLLLQSDCEGFTEVMAAMTAELPHMAPERLAKIELVKPGHALWRRGWRVAGEALGPDGMLVTAWERIDPQIQP